MTKPARNNIRTRSKDLWLVEKRRKQIVDGALRVFLKKGYDKTSVREIADACGISIGVLYHYIGSKEDILYMIIEKGFLTGLELIEKCKSGKKPPVEALRDAIDQWLRAMDKVQDLVVFTYHELGNLQGAARQRLLDLDQQAVAVFEELLLNGVKTGDFKISDVNVVANTIDIICHLWALRRWHFHSRHTLSKFIKEQTEFIIRGLS